MEGRRPRAWLAAVAVAALVALPFPTGAPAMADEPSPPQPAVPEAPAESPANAARDFDALWDYGDPAATEARFRERLPAVRAGGDPRVLAELLSQIARTLGLRDRFEEAHALLDEAEALLPDGPSVARARVLLERGRCWNSRGAAPRAVPVFEAALAAARGAGSDFHAVDALHMLGIAAEPEAAIAWNERAIAAAEASSSARTRKWLGPLYNNMGWTWFERGDHAKALELFQRNRAWRLEHKADDGVALWSVAKAMRHLGRVEEALALQRQLESRYDAEGRTDGFVFEEIGECLWALDRTEEARPALARAYELLGALDWLRRSEPARLRSLHERGAVPAPLPEDLGPPPAEGAPEGTDGSD